MEILENYNKALEKLQEYFGVDNLGCYAIEEKDEPFTIFAGEEIGWADTEKDLEERDGEYYQEAIIQLVEKEELTLVLVDTDMGGDNYWIIFKSENKREY